jgi:hypothetical protein
MARSSRGGKQRAQRDARGRWVKGYCPNPSGRPRKYANVDIGDTMLFKNKILEVATPEGQRIMTREGAILHRLFQSALQGDVRAQMYLDRKFEQARLSRGALANEINRVRVQMAENPDWKPTLWQEIMMAQADALLSQPGERLVSTDVPKAPRKRSRKARKER